MISIYIIILITWVAVALTGILMKKNRLRKVVRIFSYVTFLLILFEVTSLTVLRITSGMWLFNVKGNKNNLMFEPHPYLVAAPKKNMKLEIKGKTYTHNSSGYRGKEFLPVKSKPRIIALGGSTTYCSGVSDNETWPYQLGIALKDSFEVLNLGVPGYSTVENLIQTALLVPEFHPDIVILHCGLNDMRNYNADHLKPDYSGFHPVTFYRSMGFCFEHNLPKIATLRIFIILMQKTGLYPVCREWKKTTERPATDPDTTALYLYRRNLTTIARMLKNRHIRVIFAPQVLNYEVFNGKKLIWWIPFTSDDEIIPLLNTYNHIMENVAGKEQIVYAKKITEAGWIKADFIDPSHLNGDANRRFAEILRGYVRELSVQP